MRNETPLPADLGGFQNIVWGTVAKGDLLVWDAPAGRAMGWADPMIGFVVLSEHSIMSPSGVVHAFSVYRKMPVPSHRLDEARPSIPADDKILAETGGLKPTNPKDLIGSNKLPLHLWPNTATALGALALLDGALKYGRSNFRHIGVRASIYYDAFNRHTKAWFEGEDNDPESGLPHLAHALACVAILVDAQAAGKLNDDRMFPANYREFVNSLTPHVARLKALHAERSPKHYTIKDGRL